MKMDFDYFQIQKWMLQTVRAEKVDEKMGHLSSFNVSKKVRFLQYCAVLSKKPQSIKAIYIYTHTHTHTHVYMYIYNIYDIYICNIYIYICIYYMHLKVLITLFQKMINDIVYRSLSHHPWDISDNNVKKMLTQEKFFDFKTLTSPKE